MSESYVELKRLRREAATLDAVANLLGWDQETCMPPAGADFRAVELAAIGRLAHERATDARVGELLAQCEADTELTSDSETRANLREMRRDFDRASKLPADLVARMNETSSRAVEAWKRARETSSYDEFRPWLDRQIELNREKAACYGTPEGGDAYDSLLEDYEPGMRASELDRIFAALRAELVPLIDEIAGSTSTPDTSVHSLEVSRERQLELSQRVLHAIGFDLQAGRLDTSTHPFSTGLGPGDTRITTRFRDDQVADSLGSTLHEAGHGMYEQGLARHERWGEPLAEPLGLGIHESQSRLWENHVGRSRAFWKWARPLACRVVGADLERYSAEDLYAAMNVVQPNLIRVESDEATYNLHILIRFDLERAMFRGDLQTSDLPDAWNERVHEDLGLDVPDDARGCMQDIHWSIGSIGYFPTYSLGNLYAAQLWEAIGRALPDLDEQISRGEFSPLLGWLRENVHAPGRRDPAGELCERLTGAPLDHAPLMRHLSSKYGEVYGLPAHAR